MRHWSTMADPAPSSARSAGANTPPEALFLFGAVSQYIGAAIAVSLFDEIAAPGVALLRVGGAGLMLIAIRRPWRRAWTRTDLALAAAFGSVLALMNLMIYLAIAELPLGNAVAIEFTGPIAVAALGTRTRRNAAALVLAVAGVGVLAEVQPEGSAAGIIFALFAGAMWAAYIVLGHRVARVGAAQDGLGVGTVVGALVILPFGVGHLAPAIDMPSLLLLAAATGLLSNVIPYSLDQIVMQRISRGRFALLQAMLPVTASIIGLVALDQRPSVAEGFGMALVIAAIAIRSRDVEPTGHNGDPDEEVPA
jgi:inner membrane transporter RhtA